MYKKLLVVLLIISFSMHAGKPFVIDFLSLVAQGTLKVKHKKLNLSSKHLFRLEGLDTFFEDMRWNKFRKCKKIDLSNNWITQISPLLHYNPYIEEINLSHNKITEFNVLFFRVLQAHFPSLKKLNLLDNPFIDVLNGSDGAAIQNLFDAAGSSIELILEDSATNHGLLVGPSVDAHFSPITESSFTSFSQIPDEEDSDVDLYPFFDS